MSLLTAEHPPTLGNAIYPLFKSPKHVLHLMGMHFPEIHNLLYYLQPQRSGLKVNTVFHGAARWC